MENNAEFKILHRVFILVAFLTVFIAHALTVQPSVPFWDCGESLCAMTWQQVSHPPGSPLLTMIGRVVQIIIPFGDLGWRGNMVSVIASGAAVALLYMMSVIVMKNLRKDPITTLGDAIAVYGASFVGALAFGFSASFWFNSVEIEMYATSVLFVVLIMYLMMRWTQVADEEGNEKYILLSIYLVGLSIGIHQISLLAIFMIILTVYFRKYPVTPKTFITMSLIALGIFFIIFQVIILSLPAFLSGKTAHRNEALEFAIKDSFFLQFVTVVGIIGICYLLYWSYKKKKAVLALSSFALISLIFSYTAYAHVLLRANANPPMNENEPKKFSMLASYVGREQYGSAPMWPRRYQYNDEMMTRRYNEQDKNGNYVYGQWNPPGRKAVTRKDGMQIAAPDWNNINTAGELSYLWKYQINQMYLRYFFWNFVGRMSDVQDAGVAWFDTKGVEELSYKTGITNDIFPIQYFALPLLLGLIGLYYQFKKDPKFAVIFLATFLVMGVLTAIYQNQQNPQPRERDTFYIGSCLVFGMWIGMGAYALIDILNKKSKTTIVAAAIIVVSLILVPVNMLVANAKAYGRAGNYLPFDYAYNLLQSVEQDAIVFTNGDNDTFSVWYMQDVAGVRRDVRLCNLSLGNTLWYVDQLKNREPWGAKKVPLTFPDDSLRVDDEYEDPSLSYEYGPEKVDRISVRKEILAKYTDDQSIIDAGAVTFTFIGREVDRDEQTGKVTYMHRIQDKLVREIILQTKFERPVYFSNSVGGDATCGLSGYFLAEGLCYRVCPVAPKTYFGNRAYNEEVMDKILLNVDNSNDYSKTQKYGLKLRNLSNNGTYYDETCRRTVMMAYPEMFILYANYLAEVKKDYVRSEKILNSYLENISVEQFPLSLELEYRIASIYKMCGNAEKAKKFALLTIKSCEEQIANEELEPFGIYYEQLGRYKGPFQYASDAYKLTAQWDKSKSSLEQLISRMQPYKAQMQSAGATEETQHFETKIASLKVMIELIAIDKLEAEGKLQEALAEAKLIEAKLLADADPYIRYFMNPITAKKSELEMKLGIAPQPREVDSAIAMNN
jgi:hypothetical protein